MAGMHDLIGCTILDAGHDNGAPFIVVRRDDRYDTLVRVTRHGWTCDIEAETQVDYDRQGQMHFFDIKDNEKWVGST